MYVYKYARMIIAFLLKILIDRRIVLNDTILNDTAAILMNVKAI